jgi:hypothetical protein
MLFWAVMFDGRTVRKKQSDHGVDVNITSQAGSKPISDYVITLFL